MQEVSGIYASLFLETLIKNGFAGLKVSRNAPLNTLREYDFVFSFVLHSCWQTPKRYSVVSLHFVPVRLLMLAAIMICSQLLLMASPNTAVYSTVFSKHCTRCE